MALADYRLCDICSKKCFYDSDLMYDYADNPENGLCNTGDIVVICQSCSETHEIIIQKKPATLVPEGGPF